MNEPRFDVAKADRAQSFFEKVLVHTKGRHARKPFLLAPWQADDIIRPLFGCQVFDEQVGDWVRQYRTAWLEYGRGNGKSEILAGLALKMLCADDEEGAEVYGAAKDRDQAALVYNVVKRMVELSPMLSRRLDVIDSKKRILDVKTGSFYQIIAADAEGNLGQNPYAILFDEVAVQPSRDLWDALRTGMGKRDQPLMIAATTAGNDPNSFGAEESAFSQQVQDNPELDRSRLVFIRRAKPTADIWDEQAWFDANPALGDFLSLRALREEAEAVKLKPSEENSFRQFRMNQWVSNVSRWLSTPIWDENAGIIKEDELKGMQCYGGLDLASVSDFTAWVLEFPTPTETIILPRFFLPRVALEKRTNMRPTLEMWERQGFLTVTDGDVIDYSVIRAQIDRDATDFGIVEIAHDPWNATELANDLADGGLTIYPIPQTTKRLSAPAKELERRLGARTIRHGGNPVLRWMAGNATLIRDGDGNIKPDKKRSSEKIDGIVALVMAIGAEIREREAPPQAPRIIDLGDVLANLEGS